MTSHNPFSVVKSFEMHLQCMYLGESKVLQYFKLFCISRIISVSVYKTKFIEVLIDGVLWRAKLCQQCMSVCAWLMFNHFKQGLIFHNRRFPWPWFVFEAHITFLEISEPVLWCTFVDSSFAFDINNFFCHCSCTYSFFSGSCLKWL